MIIWPLTERLVTASDASSEPSTTVTSTVTTSTATISASDQPLVGAHPVTAAVDAVAPGCGFGGGVSMRLTRSVSGGREGATSPSRLRRR